MRKREVSLLLIVTIWVLFSLGSTLPVTAQFISDPVVASMVTAAPTIDGNGEDEIWDQATPIIAQVAEGTLGDAEVEIRAVYDQDNVYFRLTWPDATQSITDVTSEDRVALLWQITPIERFNVLGCNQACHVSAPEGMWFEEESERADLWQWHASLNVVDDAYLGFSDGAEWRFHDPGEPGNDSRGDITGQAIWADGVWMLEFMRSLDTGDHATGDDGMPVDVAFVPGEPYYFGIVVMDGSDVDHSAADFAIGFILGDADTPIASSSGEEEQANNSAEPRNGQQVHFDEIVALKTTTPPTLDGSIEEPVWENTDISVINVTGGAIRRVDVTVQAVYDDENLYMVLQWPDTTESTNRREWNYSRDGWERGNREDRFAILWQITEIDGFERLGCNIACHSDEPPIGMWFNNEGEYGDLWNWKAARTNPMGYLDDGWMGPYSGHADGGRYADPGLSSYARNESPTGEGPGYVWLDMDDITVPPGVDPAQANKFLLESDITPVNSSMAFNPGDTVPGYILRESDGSRADVRGYGLWADGVWTVELMRALDTGDHALLWDGKAQIDVTFVPGETYHFSLVVMDNTDRDHSTEETGIPFTLVK